SPDPARRGDRVSRSGRRPADPRRGADPARPRARAEAARKSAPAVKLKHKPADFVVRESVRDDYIRPRGSFRVYRVTKRKRTSLEAAGELARRAGVPAADVGIAGLKDRQGVTTQFMSVPGGRIVRMRTPDLSIEPVGFADEVLESRHSLGNDF